MRIKIISVKSGQLNLVTELYNEYMMFYNKPSNENVYKAYLHERVTNNEAKIYVALSDDNTPLGFVLNYYSFSSVSQGKVIILNDLYVSSKYRKNGIAEKLINKAFDLAKESGAIRVDLGTAKDNYSAQKLYERIGFIKDEDFYAY
ncbi:GNAT family N-acetyltransferase, partial [Tenacibaculum sp.]|nr:GNAT family N-acetyltransferase [Tenacibaculum sp.]